MVSFELFLKHKAGKERITGEYLDAKQASSLFSKVLTEFTAYSVRGEKENQPFLYLRIMPISDGSNTLYGEFPTAYFDVDVKEQMVEFIEANISKLL